MTAQIINISSLDKSKPPLSDRVKVIGIGNAGLKIVEKLSMIKEASGLEIAGVDTDSASIMKSTITAKYLVGAEWTNGIGTGGDVLKGESAIAHKSNIAVKNFISNGSLLILVGGFGGGTATGGMPIIARFARERNIPVLMLVTLPFSFEGHSKRDAAEAQINNLLRTKSTVITIPNDLLYCVLPDTTPFDKAFSMANEEVAKAVLGIAELLRCDSTISVDLCDLLNVLAKGKTDCGIGIGTASSVETKDRVNDALKNLLSSPLLGGKQRLKISDALIISLTGGSDLTIGEMRFALDTLKSFAGEHTEIVVGANIDELYEKKIQLTVIPITYDKSNAISTVPIEEKELFNIKTTTHTAIIRNVNKLLKHKEEQPELPFTTRSRGIFTPTSQTLYNGEDIDIPTFQRKEIHIDKGR
ncbi:MAG TPA: hypothetical protein DD381_11360 [Lentisphaeria bacterium]|nr:MAG: hypothetical protein A2X47_12755 [Lentisphaerae bacterium GWF2_38_69]HBM16927.1 hypothetical protein [Lentisphaeria bacterium]